MRSRSKSLLTYVLLATYAGIGILGEGLHGLVPEAGHNHHLGLTIVRCTDAHYGGDQQYAARDTTNDLASLTANCHSDSHLCEICQFLFEAISQPAEAPASIDWQPLVVATYSLPRLIHTPISLGSHVPRGPPLLLG